jgi:hypothetical protein
VEFRLTSESKVIRTSIPEFITFRVLINLNCNYVSVFIGRYLLVFKAVNEVVFEENDKIMRITESMLW